MFRFNLRSAKLATVLSEQEVRALHKAIGENIREKRLARSMTQANLSEKTGISTKHLSRLELASGTNVSLETLASIAKVLGCSLANLLEAGPIEIDGAFNQFVFDCTKLNDRQLEVLSATAQIFLERPSRRRVRK